MNRTSMYALGLACSAAMLAWQPVALAAEHQPQPHKGMQGQMGNDGHMGNMGNNGHMGGKMGMMDDAMMTQMQDHMLEMHELMHRISETDDPQKKEALKAEQKALMKSNMQMMMGKHRQQPNQ